MVKGSIGRVGVTVWTDLFLLTPLCPSILKPDLEKTEGDKCEFKSPASFFQLVPANFPISSRSWS